MRLVLTLACLCFISFVTVNDAVARNVVLTPEQQKQAMKAFNQAVAVQANNTFAVNLYTQLAQENEGDNLFFSPFSMESALAMTYEGARGKTAKQMFDSLQFNALIGQVRKHQARYVVKPNQFPPITNANVHGGFARLTDRFNDDGNPYQLAVANSLWGERTLPFRETFIKAMQQHYNAGIESVDFKTQFEQVRKRINAWVEGRTNERIKDLLPAGSLDGLTRLVLVNAIYFKSDWAAQFNVKNTGKRPFKLHDGTQIHHELMHQTGQKYPHTKQKGFAAIELPYKGDELSMIVILPDKHNGLPTLEKELSSAFMVKLMSQLKEEKISVMLPKFKLETKYQMKGTLKSMGMTDLFDSAKADLTGLTDSSEGKGLYVDQVFHNAFIEVNEEGSEAAAATAVVTKFRSAPRQSWFYASHPFIFAIRDRQTGTILFMGRVVNPAG